MKTFSGNILKQIILKLQHLSSSQKIFFLFLCFIVLMWISSVFPIKFDLSKGRAYSLSSASKEIVKNINKPVTITAYLSSDVPPRLIPLKQDVLDFLREYSQNSPNKIKLIIKDPTRDPSAKREALENGVPQLQFSEVEKDQYKVSSSFFGLTISNARSLAAIPQVVTVSSLEYDITSAIYRLNRAVVQKIVMVNFRSIYDPREDTFTTLKRSLDKQFEVQETQLSSGSGALDPTTTKALLWVMDGSALTPSEDVLLSLENYLQKGGNVIVFVDGTAVTDGLVVSEVRHSIFDFLEQYGVIVNPNLALSYTAKSAAFATGLGAFRVAYPLWLSTNQFDNSTQDFANVGQLTFPWASSLSIKDASRVRVLVQSMNNSWIQEKDFVIIPNGIPVPKKETIGSFPLVAEIDTSKTGKLLIIPSSRFVREQYLGESTANVEFVLNVLNRYVSSGALSGIRSRSSIQSPLKPILAKQKEIIRYLVIFGFPGLFLMVGLFSIAKRGKKSQHEVR